MSSASVFSAQMASRIPPRKLIDAVAHGQMSTSPSCGDRSLDILRSRNSATGYRSRCRPRRSSRFRLPMRSPRGAQRRSASCGRDSITQLRANLPRFSASWMNTAFRKCGKDNAMRRLGHSRLLLILLLDGVPAGEARSSSGADAAGHLRRCRRARATSARRSGRAPASGHQSVRRKRIRHL